MQPNIPVFIPALYNTDCSRRNITVFLCCTHVCFTRAMAAGILMSRNRAAHMQGVTHQPKKAIQNQIRTQLHNTYRTRIREGYRKGRYKTVLFVTKFISAFYTNCYLLGILRRTKASLIRLPRFKPGIFYLAAVIHMWLFDFHTYCRKAKQHKLEFKAVPFVRGSLARPLSHVGPLKLESI